MKAKLKERLQCRGCKVPYCDALCTDLSDEQIDWIMELANQLVIEELEAIEAKFPYNCAIEDYGWIWVDLKNRIAELTENKMEQDLPLVIEDFRIGFEYEELQLDSNRYLNKGMIWVKKVYGFSSPRLHKMNVLLDEGKLRNIIKQK